MIVDMLGQLAASLFGGLIADGVIGRSRANAAKRRALLHAHQVGSEQTRPPETPSVLHSQQSEIAVPITVGVGPA